MKKWRWLILLLPSLIWLLDWRWNQRFENVTVTPAEVEGHHGRRLTVQSLLDCTPDKAWREVQTPSLLLRIAAPLLGFTGRDGRPLPTTWQAGETTQLELYGLTFIPLGRHNIHLVYVDETKRELLTHENGGLAKIWNHRINIQPHGNGQTLYTDEIDIYAGALTPLIVAFAYVFYRHRQTQWQKLAPQLE